MHDQFFDFAKCAVIVAHPDDETLWAGGCILLHPDRDWTIITLCRRSDRDRAPKFYRALEQFGATGAMGDLDDGPKQRPLRIPDVEDAILELLPDNEFDLVITHGSSGEYTRHRRHEETADAVMGLQRNGRLAARTVWMFAYEDGGGKYLPRASEEAEIHMRLPDEIWEKKYAIITKTYGFGPASFEARTTPTGEAFRALRPNKP
ncbi:MAG: hypothetical protein JSU70_12770 [Phycisphaerales bacterium]|nr:MAG: hypothetical protein JSU70_12770 [Phycisphaerales bacterium]